MELEQPGVLSCLLAPPAALHSTEVTEQCSATLPVGSACKLSSRPAVPQVHSPRVPIWLALSLCSPTWLLIVIPSVRGTVMRSSWRIATSSGVLLLMR